MYIYSTLSSDQIYTTEVGDVMIKGGANIPDKHLLTPLGKVTSVTEAQYAALDKHYLFKLHEANGFIRADKNKEDAEKVASDMTGRDDSAPDTAESLSLSGDVESVDTDKGVVRLKGK